MNKIKKSIAVLAAFLLMSNSSLNAFSPVSPSCFDWADRIATRVGFMQGWTHAQEHQAFLALYDECVDFQNQE